MINAENLIGTRLSTPASSEALADESPRRNARGGTGALALGFASANRHERCLRSPFRTP